MLSRCDEAEIIAGTVSRNKIDFMYSNKSVIRVVGILFITATVTSSLSIFLTESAFEAIDFLEAFSNQASQIAVAEILMLIDAIAVSFIAILLFPILKKKSETLALGYVAMRIMEGVLFAAYVVIVLAILSLSREYSLGTIQDAAGIKPMGQFLLSLAEWTFDIGLGIPFTISALILNYLLFRFSLVPRWLSAWGFIGALVTMIIVLLKFFDIQVTESFDFIIGIQEMVFALWLIVKGFNSEYQKNSVDKSV